MVKGKLIIIEAGDGCGKATQTMLRTAAWHFAEERKLSSTTTAGAPVPPISAMSPA